MKRNKKQTIFGIAFSSAAIVLVGFLFLFSSSQAAINKNLNYQGLLADSSGTPVADGSYTLHLKIYALAGGGSPLWSADQSVSTINGIFSTMLDVSTLDFDGSAFYLGVAVGTDPEMTPRKEIGSVPQAINANNVIGDGLIDVTGNINTAGAYQVDGNTALAVDSVSGNLYAGYQAGFGKVAGSNMVFIGSQAGYGASDDSYSIGIGTGALYTGGASENIAIGYRSGYLTTNGYENIFIGDQSGYQNTDGYSNVFIGDSAGISNTTGSSNVFLGYRTGYETAGGSSNTVIGDRAGYGGLTGSQNIILGAYSGSEQITGTENIGIGVYSLGGWENGIPVSGSDNVALGQESLGQITTGYENVSVGSYTGTSNTEGYRNVFVGNEAGNSNVTGSGNIFLGYQAGYNETGSNKLYIENSNSATPLIYGEFDNDILQINGQLNAVATEVDGATAVASIIDTSSAWATNGSKLLSVRNNGVEKMVLNSETGGLFLGEDPVTLWGSQGTGYGLVVIHDWTDANDNDFYTEQGIVDSADFNEYAENYLMIADFKTASPNMMQSLTYSDTGNGFNSHITQGIAGDDVYFKMTIDNTDRTYLHPGVADGASAVAYELDTHNSLSTAGSKLLSLQNLNSEKFAIDYAGVLDTSLGAGTVVSDANGILTVSSDERLKDVSGYYTSGLDAILNINPIQYHWNGQSGLDTENLYAGFSAQNVQEFIPEAVGVDGRGYLTLSDRPILAATINAIREQQGMISGLDLKTSKNVTTLEELILSIDTRFGSVGKMLGDQGEAAEDQAAEVEAQGKLIAGQESRISSLEATALTLEDQVAELRMKLNTETNLAQIDLNAQDTAFIKLLLGVERVANPEDVDVLGKLSAKILSTGGIEIAILDPEAATIGTVTIVSADGTNDGKSAVVKTKAVAKDSKIFATPNKPVKVGVTKVSDGESFTIETDEAVLEPLKVDWWIVETN